MDIIHMGELLTMVPEGDVLNSDVLGRLQAAWSEIPANDIAQLGVFGIVRELMVTLPDNNGFSNALRLKVAEELMALLERFGVNSMTAQPQVVAAVRVERNFSEMSLRQLLEAIVANPSLYHEALRYVMTHRELQNAIRKTYKWVVPGNQEGDGIDVDATVRYVLDLDMPHAVPQRRVNGRRPVWLGRAMGVDDLPLVHVITGRLTQGPDENGFDWATLPRELLEAILWARKINHSLLPDLQSDVYGWSEQLFCKPLPRRFQDIWDDYLDAKEARVSTTDGIRVDWPEDLPFGSVFAFAVAAQVVAVDYEALVRQAAKRVAPLHVSGMGASVCGGVYDTIHVSGMGAHVDGVVVLSGGSVSGMSASGLVYMPLGRTISSSGMGANVQVINQTWRQLADRLGLV